MSNLSDLAINTTASSSEVFSNDTAVKTYMLNVYNRDKVSPWSVWTETYTLPFSGKLEPVVDGVNGFTVNNVNYNSPAYIKGIASEAHGRRFLGGDIHVSHSFRGTPDVDITIPIIAQGSSDGDKMLVYMYKRNTQVASRLGGGNVQMLTGLTQQYVSEIAKRREDAGSVRYLMTPRFYSNDPSTENYSLEIPSDSSYIGNNEYWYLHMDPVLANGDSGTFGWFGITVNLRFASLLET